MIIGYIDSDRIPEWDKMKFSFQEKLSDFEFVKSFYKSKMSRDDWQSTIEQMASAEIFVLEDDENSVIVRHSHTGRNYLSIFTGKEANEFLDSLIESIQKKKESLELLTKKIEARRAGLKTKSDPPPEIKLPEKKNG